jgi:hypothetical protein
MFWSVALLALTVAGTCNRVPATGMTNPRGYEPSVPTDSSSDPCGFSDGLSRRHASAGVRVTRDIAAHFNRNRSRSMASVVTVVFLQLDAPSRANGA